MGDELDENIENIQSMQRTTFDSESSQPSGLNSILGSMNRKDLDVMGLIRDRNVKSQDKQDLDVEFRVNYVCLRFTWSLLIHSTNFSEENEG